MVQPEYSIRWSAFRCKDLGEESKYSVIRILLILGRKAVSLSRVDMHIALESGVRTQLGKPKCVIDRNFLVKVAVKNEKRRHALQITEVFIGKTAVQLCDSIRSATVTTER